MLLLLTTKYSILFHMRDLRKIRYIRKFCPCLYVMDLGSSYVLLSKNDWEKNITNKQDTKEVK